MKQPRVILGVLVGITVIGVLLYRSIDTAISQDHLSQQMRIQREQLGVVRNLLLQTATNLTRDQIERVASEYKDDKNHVVNRHSDQIEIDGVVFRFKGDAVVDVSFVDNDSSEGEPSRPK